MSKLRSEKSTNVRTQEVQLAPKVPATLKRAVRWAAAIAPSATALLLERRFFTPRRLRRPLPEEAVLLTGKRGSVRYQGLEIPTWTWGEEGPTVLLVHGWEGRGSQLARTYAATLAERGYRVVAFDVPGHGDAPDSLMSMIGFAEVVHRVARVLGPIHAIIAHSVGGAGTLLAQARSHIADRLVIVAAPLHPRDYVQGFGDMLGLDPSMRARVVARMEARLGVSLDAVDTRHEAHNIQVPVLVVHDDSDPAVPYSHGVALAKALPQATLLTTHGLAHQRVLRGEQVVAKVIEHLGPQQKRRSLAEVIDMELFAPELRHAV